MGAQQKLGLAGMYAGPMESLSSVLLSIACATLPRTQNPCVETVQRIIESARQEMSHCGKQCHAYKEMSTFAKNLVAQINKLGSQRAHSQAQEPLSNRDSLLLSTLQDVPDGQEDRWNVVMNKLNGLCSDESVVSAQWCKNRAKRLRDRSKKIQLHDS